MSLAHSTIDSRMAELDEKRLEQVIEAAIDPDLPICDPHHHLWDFRSHRYLLPELLADTGGGHNIVSTVFLECTAFYRADGPVALQPVGETEFVNGVAAMCASGRYGKTRAAAAIVSFANLLLGAKVEEVLRAHIAAGNGRFRGIRHSVAWNESEDIPRNHTGSPPRALGEASFREGFAVLGKLGLTFDAWLYHPQVKELTDLARAFPDQPIVLNHCGGPLAIGPYAGRRDAVFQDWRAAIRDIARCPNVHVKLGGLGMKICGYDFHTTAKPPTSQMLADAWKPYIDTCIDAFGPDRAMFESNFPVDKFSGSYAVYWNAFKRLTAGASAGEKAALFRGTAERFYAIG